MEPLQVGVDQSVIMHPLEHEHVQCQAQAGNALMVALETAFATRTRRQLVLAFPNRYILFAISTSRSIDTLPEQSLLNPSVRDVTRPTVASARVLGRDR